jgi:hypothetical protein
MFQYEMFRQSIIGWAALGSFLWLSFHFIGIDENTLQWIAAIVLGLASSPIFGYIISQLNRAYYIVRKNRPNDVDLEIQALYTSFHDAISNISDPVLKTLGKLPPKDLHRVVWVSYANKQLRDRSESYWERYYTNTCIVLGFAIGVSLAVPIVIGGIIDGSTAKQSIMSLYIWPISKLIVIVALSWALLIARRAYLEICQRIENSWISSFTAEVRRDPGKFASHLFNFDPLAP